MAPGGDSCLICGLGLVSRHEYMSLLQSPPFLPRDRISCLANGCHAVTTTFFDDFDGPLTVDNIPLRSHPRPAADVSNDDDDVRYEHISGPHCQSQIGYSGARISDEEVQDATTAQYMFLLDQDGPEERCGSSQLVLTGLKRHFTDSARHGLIRRSADYPPGLANATFLEAFVNNYMKESIDGEFALEEKVQIFSDEPQMHTNTGRAALADGPKAQNQRFWSEVITQQTGRVWGIAVHPACLAMFARQCEAALGVVDLDSLVRVLFSKPPPGRSSLEEWSASQEHTDVQDSWEYFSLFESGRWRHVPGLEYLASNPVIIPKLRECLEEAIEDTPQDGRTVSQQPAFKLAEQTLQNFFDPERLTVESDGFGSLPLEIRDHIVTGLQSEDICNLRVASRAFRQLPNLIWRDLIRQQFPWIWEIEDAFLPAERRLEYYWVTLRHGMRGDERLDMSLFQPDLTKQRINWLTLYRSLRKASEELPGLKKRKLVYARVEYIVAQVKELRQKRAELAAITID